MEITLNAPEKVYESDDASALPTISGIDTFLSQGSDVTVGMLRYVDTMHGAILDAAPTTQGWYEAHVTVTVGGKNYTLTVAYKFWQSPETRYFNVSFDAGGGSGTMDGLTQVESLTLPRNAFTAPSENMLFAGWSDGRRTYPENYPYTLTSDVTFTAQWAPSVTVTFDAKGGSEIAPQRIIKNKTATNPGLPTKEGCFAQCWMLDGEPYNFSRPVTEDITLTVEWMDFYRLELNSENDTLPDLERNYANNESRWRKIECGPESTISAHSGNHCITTEYVSDSEIAVLDIMNADLSGVPGATLSFWYCNPADPETGNFDYLLEILSLSRYPSAHDTWQQATIQYPSQGAKSFLFHFWGISQGGCGVYLDDIVLTIGSHDLSYSVDGNVLTAVCGKEDCSLTDHMAALTLCAPEMLYTTDGKSPLATVVGTDAFRMQLGVNAAAGEIEYYRGDMKLDAAPTAAGSYTAKVIVTVDGTEYVLTKDYTIYSNPQDQQSVTIDDQISVNFLLDLDARPNVQRVAVAHIDPQTGSVQESAAYTDFADMEKDGNLYKIPADVAPAQIGDTSEAQSSVDDVAALDNSLSVNTGGKIERASFMALTKPEFRFYTKRGALTGAQAAALNDKITVTGSAAARFVRNAENGAILLEVTGIEAENMDKLITITIDGFGTISFRGNDFARMLARNEPTAVLGAALYNYGAAAKACFDA